jgi:hypothetical protein
MKISRSLLLSLMTGVLLLFAVQAEANMVAIPGLYNTGVDNSGALLPGGAIDPHYTLISSADPTFTGPNAYVIYAASLPGYLPNGPNSQWISPSATAAWTSPGEYIYQVTFNLTGLNPNSAIITGQWTSDNDGVNILINGKGTGYTTPIEAFYQFYNFTIRSGFVSGLNTLDFVVDNYNEGGWAGPTALRVEMSGTASTVPIPPTMLLLASGLIGLVGVRRKLKN